MHCMSRAPVVVCVFNVTSRLVRCDAMRCDVGCLGCLDGKGQDSGGRARSGLVFGGGGDGLGFGVVDHREPCQDVWAMGRWAMDDE